MENVNSPQMIKKILDMWKAGKTGGQIAEVVNKTRSSVMGIIHRARRNGQTAAPRVGERNKFRKKPEIKNKRILREIKLGLRETPEIPAYAYAPVTNGHVGVNILDLKTDSCRYIVRKDDVWNTFYCGAPITKGSYCDCHAALCYTLVMTRAERKKKRNVFIIRASR